MNADEPGGVRISDDDLRMAREAAERIKENLRVLSGIAQRTLIGARAAANDVAGYRQSDSGFKNEFLIFSPGSAYVIHANPPDGPCYVTADPPGVTRPCNFEEANTCHAVDEVLTTLKA